MGLSLLPLRSQLVRVADSAPPPRAWVSEVIVAVAARLRPGVRVGVMDLARLARNTRSVPSVPSDLRGLLLPPSRTTSGVMACAPLHRRSPALPLHQRAPPPPLLPRPAVPS